MCVCKHWPVSQGRPWSVIFSVCWDKCPGKGAYHPFTLRSGAGRKKKEEGERKGEGEKGVRAQRGDREEREVRGGFLLNMIISLEEEGRQPKGETQTELSCLLQIRLSAGEEGRKMKLYLLWMTKLWAAPNDSSASKDPLLPPHMWISTLW